MYIFAISGLLPYIFRTASSAIVYSVLLTEIISFAYLLNYYKVTKIIAYFRSFFRRRSCIRLDSANIIKKSNMQTKPRARLGILRAALLHIIFKFRKCETPNYFRYASLTTFWLRAMKSLRALPLRRPLARRARSVSCWRTSFLEANSSISALWAV